MHTLFAMAAAMSTSLAGPHDCLDYDRHCFPGFAPAIYNGHLVTPPPEDQTRVYTPGYSPVRGRLWVGDDVTDVESRRIWRQNPGRVSYGAADIECERVHLRVNNQYVSISPWDRWEREGFENFERARQQWLQERGYTGGVRTFVNPKRLRALLAGPVGEVAAEKAQPEPSATIRLRKERGQEGRIRRVDAGVAGGLRVVQAGEAVRVSFPQTVRAETVERATARGSTGEAQTRTADAER